MFPSRPPMVGLRASSLNGYFHCSRMGPRHDPAEVRHPGHGDVRYVYADQYLILPPIWMRVRVISVRVQIVFSGLRSALLSTSFRGTPGQVEQALPGLNLERKILTQALLASSGE